MKIEIERTPDARYHRAAARVTDWFGLRVRFYRLLLTGNMPGGEWVAMDPSNPMPSKSLARKLVQAELHTRIKPEYSHSHSAPPFQKTHQLPPTRSKR